MDESFAAFAVVEPPRRPVPQCWTARPGRTPDASAVVAFRAVEVPVTRPESLGTGTNPA